MTNKTIEKLENQIKEEQVQLKVRIAELTKSNMEDQVVLDTYVERFTQAVQDAAGEKELSVLEEQRNQAFKRVEQNNEVIRILTTTEGSKNRRVSADLVTAYIKAVEELEAKAEHLYTKLKPLHDQLSAGIHQLYDLHEEARQIKVKIDRTKLDEPDRKRLGLRPNVSLADFNYKSKICNVANMLHKNIPNFTSIKHARKGNK